MGASHSVELFADQESPTEPGQKSIISASLDDLDPAVSSDQFMAEIVEFMKWPVDTATEAVLKSCTVTDNGPDDFTVKVVVDGAKLDSYGFGKGDGTDRIRSWKRVVVDKKANRVVCHDYVPEEKLGAWADEASDKEPIATAHTQILLEPTRIEFWVTLQDGTRIYNDGLKGALYSWTDRIIGEIQDAARAKVKVTPGKAIKNAGEDSVVSEPLDEHVDYDSFFDKLVTCVKEKLAKIPDCEVEETGADEFVGRVKQDGEGAEKFHTHTCKYSAESGEMVVTMRDHEGKTVNTSFRQVHKAPLVVEAWNITRNGDRSAGTAFAKQVQKEVNEVIERANSWFG